MDTMTMDDFTRYVLTSFPEAVLEQDERTGELTISTGYKLVNTTGDDSIRDGLKVVRLGND